MAKSIKELKKENVFLKSKSEKSDVTLIELVEEVKFTSFSLFSLSVFSGNSKVSQCTTPNAFRPAHRRPWVCFIQSDCFFFFKEEKCLLFEGLIDPSSL